MNIQEKQAFLKEIAPFDRLSEEELARVMDALSMDRFAPGKVILKRWMSPNCLYILADGVVEELDQQGTVGRYTAGDTFDARALIEGRSQHDFIAQGECRCYLLPAPLFLALSRSNRAFHEFYYEDLSRKLDTLMIVQQQREAASFMLAQIGQKNLHKPVFVSPETTIQEAAALMKAHDTTAVLVRRKDEVGIFTGQDIREKAVFGGMPQTSPLGDIASYGLITLDPEDFLFEALIVMTKHSIRHVVIRRGEEILGILEQADLLNYLSNHSYLIASQIERAASWEALKKAGDAIPELIKSLHERGVKPRYISRMVTDLNRKLFRKLYERMVPEALLEQTCLIVMGSEGRGEQLLRTDQDNGLILREGLQYPELERLTAEFTEALIELGFPPCPGHIMVSNPDWAKSLLDYKKDVSRWMNFPDESAFMNFSIFYDASSAAGNSELLDEVKDYLVQLLRNQRNAIQHFAKAILTFDTPLTIFGHFAVEGAPHPGELDIKKGGIFPIVHGMRSLAMEYQLSQTNTIARIQALSGRGVFDERFTADLIDAFDFMSMLRLREQLLKLKQNRVCDNYVNPERLNKLERGLLKDSLKIVKEFRSFIGYHFKLSMVT